MAQPDEFADLLAVAGGSEGVPATRIGAEVSILRRDKDLQAIEARATSVSTRSIRRSIGTNCLDARVSRHDNPPLL
jgi:hypothetical protein